MKPKYNVLLSKPQILQIIGEFMLNNAIKGNDVKKNAAQINILRGIPVLSSD
jgi:hypothetical protein